MLPAQDTTHVVDGLATRIGEYLSDTNLAALLTACLLEVQAIEDMLWDVIGSQLLTRTFPAGTGQGELDGPPDQALLQVADLVGAPVGTYTTRQLAFLVGVWIAARKSQGRAIDILGILTTAFGSTDLGYWEFYPAGFEAWALDVPNLALVPPIAQALAIARPPGVYAVLAYGNWPPAAPPTPAMFFFGDSSPGGAAGSGLQSSVTDGGHNYPEGLLAGVVI